MQESKTLERIREAQDALASAQSAMDRVQAGLSGVESVAGTADKARRHPMATAAILFAVALAVTLTVIGIRDSDDD